LRSQAWQSAIWSRGAVIHASTCAAAAASSPLPWASSQRSMCTGRGLKPRCRYRLSSSSSQRCAVSSGTAGLRISPTVIHFSCQWIVRDIGLSPAGKRSSSWSSRANGTAMRSRSALYS
jgi:hypothetical protein